MKLLAAYYLLASCTFMLGYAVVLIVSQWAKAEVGDMVLILIFWILPCVAAVYLVVANHLYRRDPTATQDRPS